MVSQDISSLLSILASILSILMFFLAYNEKKQCKKIKEEINNTVNLVNYGKQNTEQYTIDHVETIDNRKDFRD